MNCIPHNRSEFFDSQEYKDSVDSFFTTELSHDGVDITAEFCVEKNQKSKANIVAKQAGILAGKEEVQHFFSAEYPEIEMKWNINDGEEFSSSDIILEFFGNARTILKIERVILNVLSRMSGVAFMTHSLQQCSNTPLAATRKTQWGFLDKKAVSVGGGLTHRMGLFDAVLIKENHLLAGEGIEQVITLLSENEASTNLSKTPAFYEIEVETEEEFQKVFSALYTNKNRQWNAVIMFDNFSPENIKRIIAALPSKTQRNSARIFLEISGGITHENLENYSNIGADVISMGALTHSVLPIDFSLRFK